VQANNYVNVGYLENSAVSECMTLFPVYRTNIENSIMENYSEDSRLFIIETLRRLEYLTDE
jgi:hypothetical protein